MKSQVQQIISFLVGVFGGVTLYTFHDIHFTISGYLWLGIWYFFAVFEMVYVKKVVDTVEMTTWSRTYYQVDSSHLLTIEKSSWSLLFWM